MYYIIESDGKKRKASSVECNHCKTTFLKRASFVSTNNYCSNECKSAARSKKIEHTCDLCRTSFYRNPSKNISKNNLVFCSRKCKDNAQRIGAGFEQMQPSHYGIANGAHTYRAVAFSHFPKVCMACGWNKYEQLIEVHHIDSDRTNNDISNLAVLCPTCHRAITLRYAIMGSDRIWKWVGQACQTDELMLK